MSLIVNFVHICPHYHFTPHVGLIILNSSKLHTLYFQQSFISHHIMQVPLALSVCFWVSSWALCRTFYHYYHYLLLSHSSLVSDNKHSIYISHANSETFIRFFYNSCILLRSVYGCCLDSLYFIVAQTCSYLFGLYLLFRTKMFRCSQIITTVFYISPNTTQTFIICLCDLFTFPIIILGYVLLLKFFSFFSFLSVWICYNLALG